MLNSESEPVAGEGSARAVERGRAVGRANVPANEGERAIVVTDRTRCGKRGDAAFFDQLETRAVQRRDVVDS
jgi:hypothetical protein